MYIDTDAIDQQIIKDIENIDKKIKAMRAQTYGEPWHLAAMYKAKAKLLVVLLRNL